MASYLYSYVTKSSVWKTVCSSLNTLNKSLKRVFNAFKTLVGLGKSPPTLSDMPNELLEKILAYMMASEVPFDLGRFIELGKWHQDKLMPGASQYRQPDFDSWFLYQVPSPQGEHYRDWLAVNGLFRRFRECGKLAFFSEKIILIAPSLLRTLQSGSCKNISVADRAAIFSHARHVITLRQNIGIASQFMRLSDYNIFTSIRVLSVRPLQGSFRGDRLSSRPLESALTPMASWPVGLPELPMVGTVKRHPAPQKLLDLLHGVGLKRGRMQVDLLHFDDRASREYTIKLLERQVYPVLQHIVNQKAIINQKARQRAADASQHPALT